MDLATARKTPYAWPGGYPVYAVLADGAMLCHECLHDPLVHETTSDPLVHETTSDPSDEQWRFVGADVYWEGPDEQCANCYKALPSAYGDPDKEGD